MKAKKKIAGKLIRYSNLAHQIQAIMIIRLNDKNPTVASVQEMLNFLGFRYKFGTKVEPLKADGHFGKKTQAVVLDFQGTQGILKDGIVGPITFRALENEYAERVLELNSPGADAFDGRRKGGFRTEPVLADPYGQSYPRFYLREDVAEAYRKVRAELLAQGGMLTSSGGMRSLRATVTASRSAVSFHYIGRALDLFIYSAMMDPEKDPFVVVKADDKDKPKNERGYLVVHARCSKEWPFNPLDAPGKDKITLPEVTELKNIVTYKDPEGKQTKPVTGHFVNLTELFKKHGFAPIRPRPSFYNGSMMSAEWWHFQYETGLIEQVSTFGNELLRLFSDETLQGTGPWQFRHRIFSGHSFI